LGDHAVSIFGLGCEGSPSALEFARAGIGGLRLLDHDVVDPATTVRWQFGLAAAGLLKAATLHQIIAVNYPYVSVSHDVHRIGVARSVAPTGEVDAKSETAVMASMLDGASLLYDATAEWGVQRFLAEEARKRGLPYVGVEGTPGGWGGMVVRILPEETEGCWLCLQHWRGEPVEKGGIIPPPHDEVNGDVHPAGCADPTFTGANVDLSEVALQGVRTAIETMLCAAGAKNPDGVWEIAVLALRDGDGRRVPPRWSTYKLRRHPDCAECSRRE
jgi:molybdopterin/thiamine biosynthesis adenylyltransferase